MNPMPPNQPPPTSGGRPQLAPEQRSADQRKQLIVAAAIVGPILLIFGVGITATLLNRTAEADVDVTVTKCEFSGSSTLPSALVGFTVTNNGSDTVNSVRVHIEYRDSGGARLDTDTATVRNIRPGETVRSEESTLLDAAPPGSSAQCVITGID